MHGELFSIERLEEYAKELASQHKSITGSVPAKPLLAEAEKSGRALIIVRSLLGADRTGVRPLPHRTTTARQPVE